MTWHAWRSQRLLILVALAGSLAFAVWMIIHGAHEQAAWNRFLRDRCNSIPNPIPFCEGNRPYDFNHWNSYFLAGLYAIPGLVGILLGAPLVAREVQQGTYRLSWTQSITRIHWLTVKLLVGAAATVAMSVGAVLLGEWWIGAVRAGPSISPANFDITGIAPIAYGIFAFMLGAALGAILRRTGWAVAVALIIFGGLRAAMRVSIRSHLAPVVTSSLSPAPPVHTSPSWWVLHSGWVPIGRSSPLPGSPWSAGSDIYFGCVQRLGTVHTSGASFGYFPPSLLRHCAALTKLHPVVQYQPSGHFWMIQGAESAIFIGMAAALFGLTLLFIKRWRS